MDYKNQKTELDYYNGSDLISKGDVRISPSSISKFFSNTEEWYESTMEGNQTFFGNEATVRGTIAHYYCEKMLGEGFDSKAEIEVHKYVNKMRASLQEPMNPNVLETGVSMGKVLWKHIADNGYKSAKHVSEGFYHLPIAKGVTVGGSIDLYVPELGSIIDFKTTGAKSHPKVFSRSYLLQQLTYAYMLRELGHTVRDVRLMFVNVAEVGRVSEKTGKPLKQYPSIVSEVVHVVTSDDMTMIKNILDLIALSITVYQESSKPVQDCLAQRLPKPSVAPKEVINVFKEF